MPSGDGDQRRWGLTKGAGKENSFQKRLTEDGGGGQERLGFNITMYLLNTSVGSLILARGIAAFLPCHAQRQEIIPGNHLVCGLLHSAISDAHLGQGLYCSVKWHRAPICIDYNWYLRVSLSIYRLMGFVHDPAYG